MQLAAAVMAIPVEIPAAVQPALPWTQHLIPCWAQRRIRLWHLLPACWTQPLLPMQSAVVCRFNQTLCSEFAFLAGGKRDKIGQV